MKLTEILTERISDIVYRMVPISTAIRDIKSNKFKLTLVADPNSIDARFQKHHLFYLSMGRMKLTSFTNQYRDQTRALYVLDGRKLSQNYKGIPANYISVSHGDNFNYQYDSQHTESEDRIISDKPIIPNATKYIKEIHVHIVSKDTSVNDNALTVLERAADEKHIPIYFYIDDYKSFVILNKSKAATSYMKDGDEEEVISKLFDKEIPSDSILYQLISFYENKRFEIDNRVILDLIREINSDHYSTSKLTNLIDLLDIEANKYRNNLPYLELLKKLPRYMKREKTKRIDHFIVSVLQRYPR